MGSLDTKIPEASFSEFKPLDPEDFRKQAHRAVDFIADYYNNVESLPVLSSVEPGFLLNSVPDTAPSNPEPLDDILEDVRKVLLPGMTHWASPNFFAYFPATISTAGFIGDMFATSFNSVGFNWLASPTATELEMSVMDWMANLLKLPSSFMFSGTGGGVIQTTTSEAILCTLVTARDRALERVGPGNIAKLVTYSSDQTHLTYAKACKIAGILPSNIRAIETTAEDKFSLSPERLRTCMEADVAAGLVPVFLCVTVGTTSTTAVDPVGALTEVAADFGAWVHVDAAYAGSACICPEFRPYLDGVERANSISMSPHKWFLSYLDCCCLWVKNPELLVQGLNIDPEYLKNKPSQSRKVVDYKDWQVGVGRRFRALRLWFIFRSYGVANLQEHIRSDVALAGIFEGFVVKDPRFEIVVPRRFALVCFRLGPATGEAEGLERLNRALLEEVNATGRVYITHTAVGGLYVLRFAVGATLTEERHVVAAWKLIKETADDLLGKTTRLNKS
ncbi:tryptophan decarboxylase TDC2-like [Aristolochia californica]|uniref:tryptophan decarboxylase TDC2-like n=1 Tax=Aristolochia californica TaxID=171875 RepID=UPI0035E21085